MVFDKDWFLHYQSKLLWLLNSSLTKKRFRYVLRIHKDCPDRSIVQILPNSYTVFNRWIDDRVELITDFRTHNKFAKRLYYAFKPFWIVLHIWDLFADFVIPSWSFGFNTLTVFPDNVATGGSTTVGDSGDDDTYAHVRVATGNSTQGGGNITIIKVIASTTTN